MHPLLKRRNQSLPFSVSSTSIDADNNKYIKYLYVPGAVVSTLYESLDLILITTL